MKRLLLLAALLMPAAAQAQEWTVRTLAPADSVVRAVVDTARAEPAFCLGLDVDRATKTLTVWQAIPATVTRQTRGRTDFSCPAETAMLHGHFLSAGHVDGPSDVDADVIRRLRTKPVAALIVVIDALKQVHYRTYFVQ